MTDCIACEFCPKFGVIAAFLREIGGLQGNRETISLRNVSLMTSFVLRYLIKLFLIQLTTKKIRAIISNRVSN